MNQDFDRQKDFAESVPAVIRHAKMHSPFFCFQCNRIGGRLRLRHVMVTVPVDYPDDPEDFEDGDQIPDIPDPDEPPFCNGWPQNVRPKGYYRGAWRVHDDDYQDRLRLREIQEMQEIIGRLGLEKEGT